MVYLTSRTAVDTDPIVSAAGQVIEDIARTRWHGTFGRSRETEGPGRRPLRAPLSQATTFYPPHQRLSDTVFVLAQRVPPRDSRPLPALDLPPAPQGPRMPAAVEEDIVDSDFSVEPPPARRAGFIRVNLIYTGRSKPLPFSEEDE